MKKIKSSIGSLIIYNFILFLNFLERKFKKIRIVKFDKFKNSKYKFFSNKPNFIIFSDDDYVSRDTYINGPYDYNLIKRSLKFIKKRKKITFIDVGANIGTVCISAIKDKLFKNCIAFEPNDKIFNVLKANILINNLTKSIESYDFCLADKNRDNLFFSEHKSNFGDNKFNKKKSKKSINFPRDKVKTLNSFYNKVNPKNTLIKIDVQGFEINVILGAKKFIKRGTPIVIELDKHIWKNKKINSFIKLITKNYSYFVDLNIANSGKEKISDFIGFLKYMSKNNITKNVLLF